MIFNLLFLRSKAHVSRRATENRRTRAEGDKTVPVGQFGHRVDTSPESQDSTCTPIGRREFRSANCGVSDRLPRSGMIESGWNRAALARELQPIHSWRAGVG